MCIITACSCVFERILSMQSNDTRWLKYFFLPPVWILFYFLLRNCSLISPCTSECAIHGLFDPISWKHKYVHICFIRHPDVLVIYYYSLITVWCFVAPDNSLMCPCKNAETHRLIYEVYDTFSININLSSKMMYRILFS